MLEKVELQRRQAWPLEKKIGESLDRIDEFYNRHPGQYDYYMNKLGMAHVLDVMGVDYKQCSLNRWVKADAL